MWVRPPPGTPCSGFRCARGPIFVFRASVVGLAGDDAADAALGGGVVAGAAGDQVQMAMEYGLAGRFAVVGAEIETGDGRIGGKKFGGEPLRQTVGGRPLVRGQVAERGDVSPGDDQGVAGADGKPVAEGEAGAVGGDDAFGRQGAEGAGRIHGGRIKPRREPGKRIDRGGPNPLYTRDTLGGEIAQLVEQRTENPCVIGSIPILATTFLPRRGGGAGDKNMRLRELDAGVYARAVQMNRRQQRFRGAT